MIYYLPRCREVGLTRRFCILDFCHGDVRLGSSNGYMLFHDREVGLTRRFISCHGVVRSGLPDGLVVWVCHGDVRSVYPTV